MTAKFFHWSEMPLCCGQSGQEQQTIIRRIANEAMHVRCPQCGKEATAPKKDGQHSVDTMRDAIAAWKVAHATVP